MSHRSKPRALRARAVALPLAVLACSGLAACGSSSSTTGTTANAAATRPTTAAAAASAATTKAGGTGTAAGTAGASAGSGSSSSASGTAAAGSSSSATSGEFAARLAAVRTCIQKSGVTLSPRGSGGPSSMFRNPRLPKGMTRSQYAEVLRKCGTGLAGGAGALAKRRLFDNTRFSQALVVFADCLRRNGVPVPPPNTSGKGPVFDTRGLDTTSPKFRQARQQCRGTLLQALHATAHRGTR